MDPSSLTQYGVGGVIAATLLGAVQLLFTRLEKQHKRDRERADRLEAELRELNRTIATQYSVVLADATRAVAEAIAIVRHTRR